MNSNWEAGIGPSADALLEACNAALDECSPLTDLDVRMIASALKDHITGDRVTTRPENLGADPLTLEKLRTCLEHGSGLNPYNATRAMSLIEGLLREREELVLALMWCKPRLKQEAYQRHIEWTLTKYPKPPKIDEPRIVLSDTLPGKNHSTDDALAPVEQSAKRIGEQPEAAHGDGCRVEPFKNPDDDFCPSDPRGPGRTGGE